MINNVMKKTSREEGDMTANQIAYNVHLENKRHDKVTESETNRHNVVTEGISRDTLSETKRNNLFGNQLSALNYQEQVKHNRNTELISKYGHDVNRANAITNYYGTKYSADANYAGTKYSADQHLRASKYSSDQSAAATRYAADRSFQSSKYSADKSASNTKYSADSNYKGSVYSADQRYKGTMGSAYTNAQTQRYTTAANNYNQRRLQDSKNRASYVNSGINAGSNIISSILSYYGKTKTNRK